jgi:hypothetical protein
MLLVALGALVVSACFDSAPNAGVISTENAGRVTGSIVRSDGSPVGEVAEIRLLRLSDSQATPQRAPFPSASRTLATSTVPELVSRMVADSKGAYLFPDVKPGTYRIDAILASGLRGSSGAFTLGSDSTVRLVVVVVVVPSFQFALIPSAGDSILSVWVGDPGSLAIRSGLLWSMPVVPGVADAVGVVVRRATGAVDTVMYQLSWVDSTARLDPVTTAAATPAIGSTSTLHFATDTGTVAHWTFDTLADGAVADVSGNGRNLSASGIGSVQASPFGNAVATGSGYFQRVFDVALTPQVSGTIVYEARVFLDKYPSSSLHNGRSVVMGFYEGPKLLVTDSGRIQVGGQQGTDGAMWNWYAPQTSIVPVGRWVDLAIAVEAKSGAAWAWVDGAKLALSPGVAAGSWRIPSGVFVVGKDASDGQEFAGSIDEMRVSRQIPSTLSR